MQEKTTNEGRQRVRFCYKQERGGIGRMIHINDGKEFMMTEKFTVLLDTMEEEKKRWMDNCSVVVVCVIFHFG